MGGASGGRGVDSQQLIGEIYEASYWPDHWPVVLQGMAALTESSPGGLIHRNAELEQASFAYTYNFPPDVVLRLRKTWYYREYLVPWDNHYVATAIIFGADSRSGAPVCVCANWRRSSGYPVTEDDRERLKLLVPLLSRSLGVLHRIRAAELSAASTLAVLNRLPMGIVLVDAQGEVTFANEYAHRLLEKGNGLSLKRQSGRAGLGTLAADDLDANRAIASAITATLACDPLATDHFSKYVRVPKRNGTGDYILQLSALGQYHEYHHGEHPPAAIIFLSDQSDTYSVEPELLRSSFDLTATEAKVAITMMTNSTLQEVADQLHISIDTVRAHAKRIYAKLGVDSRAGFVKLMLGLVHAPTI